MSQPSPRFITSMSQGEYFCMLVKRVAILLGGSGFRGEGETQGFFH